MKLSRSILRAIVGHRGGQTQKDAFDVCMLQVNGHAGGDTSTQATVADPAMFVCVILPQRPPLTASLRTARCCKALTSSPHPTTPPYFLCHPHVLSLSFSLSVYLYLLQPRFPTAHTGMARRSPSR